MHSGGDDNSRVLSRQNAPALFVGTAALVSLVLGGTLGRATTEGAWFAGRELGAACSFRAHFGVPCPNCGMTRSVLLALRADLATALAVNPAGPLLVLGALLLCAAMFGLVVFQRTRPAPASVERVRRALLLGGAAYASLFVAVLISHWAREVF